MKTCSSSGGSELLSYPALHCSLGHDTGATAVPGLIHLSLLLKKCRYVAWVRSQDAVLQVLFPQSADLSGLKVFKASFIFD
jgi:hypothetical protein